MDRYFDNSIPELEDQEIDTEEAFTWHIDNWFALQQMKYESPKIQVRKYLWNLLLSPNGNHDKNVVIYLALHPKEHIDSGTVVLSLQ